MRILLFMLIPLVFFAAGILFASLLWGKYKHLAEALRLKVDRLTKSEEDLQTRLIESQRDHSDLATTCRTLEEELAHLGVERETLLEQLQSAVSAQAQTSHLETRAHRAETELQGLQVHRDSLEEETANLQRELDAAREKAKASENRVRLVAEEKEEVLALATKLQAKLEEFEHLRNQLEGANHTGNGHRPPRRTDILRRRRLRRAAWGGGRRRPAARLRPAGGKGHSSSQQNDVPSAPKTALRQEPTDPPQVRRHW